MNDLMLTTETMTSIQIAELIGKFHHHVIRDIRDEIEQLEKGGVNGETKFGLSSYTTEQNKEMLCYTLTREGILQLAARYDAVTRAKLIEMAMRSEQRKPMSQLEIMHQMLGAQIEQDRVLKQHQQQLESVTEQLQEIRDNAVYVPDNWRKDINTMVKRAAFKAGGTAYSDIRTESYELLESRAHCDLKRLVTNLRTRKQQAGARKTDIDNVRNIDVIESDPRLREVYTGICKELFVKYGG